MTAKLTSHSWLQAAEHNNQDAKDRLAALSQPSPQALSRTEHNHLTESKLVRSRTQAKQRSDAAGAQPPSGLIVRFLAPPAHHQSG